AERAHRGCGRPRRLVAARRQPHAAAPMLTPELEADRAAEVDELRLAEQRMQSRPEAVVGLLGIERDRVRPLERDALPARISLRPANISVAREEAEAQLLQRLIDDPGAQHDRLDLGPGFARRRPARPDLAPGAAAV